MFDRRLAGNFEIMLLMVVFMLCGVGILTIFSAVSEHSQSFLQNLYIKQIIWFIVGMIMMISCFMVSYKQFDKYALGIYLFCVLLLVMVLLLGRYVAGSRRWLVIGPVSIQPSELVKVAVVIMLARYYSQHVSLDGLTFRELIQPALIVALPCALILKQPDLGTAGVIVLIAGTMTIFVKIEKKTLICILIMALLTIPAGWLSLKGYQKQRIMTFLQPEEDPLGAGYHIIQSKIAIGSGMINGKGFRNGTQNALSFLPEQHTDFIFSVLSEEWGFIGSGIVLILLLLVILKGLNIAYGCKDPFGTILSVGITAFIFWEVFINVGMVMGLMPVVGVPLPFISYGGSATISVLVGMGLLLNVGMRRFLFE
jgi:rod shape determining protein RodA